MPDFPIVKNVDPIILSTVSSQSLGSSIVPSVGGATSVILDTAVYIPFSVSNPITIVKMFVINGSAVSGNIDVGIYNRNGKRLVSSGSTAQVNTNSFQIFDITDTVLMPGLYYLAAVIDNSTGAVLCCGNMGANGYSALGAFEQTVFPLPSTATFATIGRSSVPVIGATQRTTV